MNKRSSSSKLLFYDLHGEGAKVQLMTDARYSPILLMSTEIYFFTSINMDSLYSFLKT